MRTSAWRYCPPSFEIRTKLDNADGAIKAGSFARVRLVRRAVESAVLVPLRAVKRDEGGRPFVYLFDAAAGQARRRSVVLGETAEDRVVVVDGLAAGEQLIVSGLADLGDGEAVRVASTGE